MKAVIFARVSSKDQEEGHSLDAQIQACFEYAIKKSYKVIEQFRVVESSKASGRPEFAKMVDYVRRQKEKVIVLCYCVDRLQRDFDEQYLELQKLIKSDKIEVHYVKTEFVEHKDMDSSSIFRKNLDVLLANDGRNRISDNVKRSIQKKLDEGTILGDSPLGYLNKQRFDKKKEKVEVCFDPDRAQLVAKLFELYASGMYSMSELCDIMNTEGLTSKKGNKLHKSHVESILKNPFYYGYMPHKGLLYKHVHPILITKELFDECQKVRTGRRRSRSKRTEKPFILKGLLKCQHCGCSYSPELKKGKYVYMRPTKSQGDCSHCYHINENKVLAQIEAVLEGMKISEKVMKNLNDELKKSSDSEHKNQIQESRKLQEQYNVVQHRSKRARELYLDGELTKDEYDEMMVDLQVDRHNLETRMQRLSNADSSFNEMIGTIFALASNAHELFKSSELDEKRRIITILFPNLEMNAEKLVFKPREPFDLFLNLQERPEWLPGPDSNQRPIG